MEIGIIDVGSHPDCNNLPPAGTSARLILINYSEVVRVFCNDDGNVIAIRLQEDARGYEFFGFSTDVGKRDEVVTREKSKQRFKHFLSFISYDVSQIQKNNIKNIVRGRFLAIIENNGENSGSIEVLGISCGLQIIDGQIRNAYENGAVFTINLSTPDNGIEFERKLPQSLGINYEDGLNIIEEILNPESITWDDSLLTFDSTDVTFDHT